MKAASLVRPLVTVFVALALVTAYLMGRHAVWVLEFKEHQAYMQTLTQWETNRPAELREFVKARYYYLANRIPKRWAGQPHDYGPVSTNVAKLAVFKGPTSGQEEYRKFLERFSPNMLPE